MQHLAENTKKKPITTSCRIELPHKIQRRICYELCFLTTLERVKIETYLELKFSIRKISQHLGRQPSTISRELKRNPSYNAQHRTAL